MVSASAWQRPAAAGWWPGGAPRVASACRHEAAAAATGGAWPRRRRQQIGRSRGVDTLKKRAEYLRIRKGARWATSGVRAGSQARSDEDRPPHGDEPRFGFTVTRQVGKAVERNRIRRRLKAAVEGRADGSRQGRFRLCPDRAPSGADVGVCCAGERPRPSASRACIARRRGARSAAARLSKTNRKRCKGPCLEPGPGQPEEPPPRHRAVGGRAARLAALLCRPQAEGRAGAPAAHSAGADARPRSSRRAAKTAP